MTAENKGQYIAGGALVLAVAAFILIVFSLLGRTDRTRLYLTDTSDERFGWRYELLVNGQGQEFEPVFADDDLTLPEGTEAVRISRVMTEAVPYAQLQWICGEDGVEVFLDGDLLYSDFQQARRDDAGFVHPDREEWDRLRRNQGDLWRQVQVMLPSEYVGKELSMVTYFSPGESAPAPEYPLLLDEEAVVADPVVFSVRYNAIMTIYAILALGIACVFLLDIHNGNMDGRTLLLCLYFLLLFLNEAYYSFAGYYSVLTERLDLRFLNTLYIAPLYLYLTLRTTTRWKWPLCGGILAWSLYEGVREFLRIHRGMVGDADSVGSGALAVFLAVAIALCAEWLRTGRRTGQDRRSFATYGLAAAGVSAAYLIGRIRAWGGLRSYLEDGVWVALSVGNFWPVVTPITDVVSTMAVIVLVSEVVRRTLRTRRTVEVLRERERLTVEGYERMLKAQEATNAANHEMRHHMTALAGILRDGSVEQAREYVASVTDGLDRLPTMRYSQNILVNTVAGAYLDQAKEQGIRVECSLAVPEKLDMADEDLNVFLTNLLENALHACRRTDIEQRRHISLKMALHENFLFIGCVNSAPGEQEAEELDREKRATRRHGYGLEAMRRIAEKYGSILLLERTGEEFSVKSNFNLRAPKTSRSAGRHG